jgi:hypothetical protein
MTWPGRQPDHGTARDAGRWADVMRGMSCRTDPVHLHSIARQLGVARITLEPLEHPGRVSWDGAKPAIAIRADMSPERRRFTLAHELAHVLLLHGCPQATDGKPSPAQMRDEERLCDAIAGSVLLPAGDVLPLVTTPSLELAHVRAVAADHQVSMSLVVSRLGDFDRRTHMLIRLERFSGRWVATRIIGRNRGLSSNLRIPPEYAAPVDGLSRADERVALDVFIGGLGYNLTGTGNKWGSTALVLATGIRRAPDLDGCFGRDEPAGADPAALSDRAAR